VSEVSLGLENLVVWGSLLSIKKVFMVKEDIPQKNIHKKIIIPMLEKSS